MKYILIGLGIILLANYSAFADEDHSYTPQEPSYVPQTLILNTVDLDCTNALAGTTTSHRAHGDGHHSAGMSLSGGCQAINYSYHDNGWSVEGKATEGIVTVGGSVSW